MLRILSPSIGPIRMPLAPSPRVPDTPPPYALVALAEPVMDHSGATLGHRIAEVADAKFPVAPGLEWHSVPSVVTAGGFYWDGAQAVPMPAAPPPTVSQPGALPTKLA